MEDPIKDSNSKEVKNAHTKVDVTKIFQLIMKKMIMT